MPARVGQKDPGFFSQIKDNVMGMKDGVTNKVKDKINGHPKAAAITMIALGALAALLFIATGSTMLLSPMIMLLGAGLVIGAIVLLGSRNSKVGAFVRKIAPIALPIIFALGMGAIWTASILAGGPLAVGLMGALFYVAVLGTAGIPLWIAQYTIPEMLRRKHQRKRGPGGVQTKNIENKPKTGPELPSQPKKIQQMDPTPSMVEQPKVFNAPAEPNKLEIVENTKRVFTSFYEDIDGTFLNANGDSITSLQMMSHEERQKRTAAITPVNNYLYWMFPTPLEKGPTVPKLTQQAAEKFRADSRYHEKMKGSFYVMLNYYGLKYDTARKTVTKGENWAERSQYWLAEGSKEFSQISVMIHTMCHCGLRTEAAALVQFFDGMDKAERKNIPEGSWNLWHSTIKQSAKPSTQK